MTHNPIPGAGLDRAFGRPYAIPTLLTLLEEGAMRPTHISRRLGQYGRFGLLMAWHLEEFGLVRISKAPGRAERPGYEIALTANGRRVAENLRQMSKFTERSPNRKCARA